jgi:NADPH2:quinone reductase
MSPTHHAVVLDGPGGPEALTWRQVPTPEPRADEILVDVALAGVNYMDVGTRTGTNGPGPYPVVPGIEGSGRVAAVGPGVSGIAVGQRVAWHFGWGSYAQRVVLPVSQAVPVPDDIDDEVAAGLLMQGLTAQHLAGGFTPVRPGDIVLVHAAAGGVGLLVTQLLTRRGARVIGRVSAPDKIEPARAAGAEHVIVATGSEFANEVRTLTGGHGVDIVLDGSGKATFDGSIASLALHGVMAYYGNTLDGGPSFDLVALPNSIRIGYPTVFDHVRDHAALLARSNELFDLVRAGELTVTIGGRYPLAEAFRAHTDLQARTTVGKLLLEA